jgi:uncharacterized protein YukJ
MAIERYSVLRGTVLDSKPGRGGDNHYQILVGVGDDRYRVAINVQSDQSPHEVLYYIDEDFHHPLLDRLARLPEGMRGLESAPGGVALDYVRGNLFDVAKLKPLAKDVDGPDNDLNEIIDSSVAHAREAAAGASLFAVGAAWGPEADKPDRYFGFRPGAGIHDIHMNQGSVGPHSGDNGVWQDGGLFVHVHTPDRWIAVFLAFQSQRFHSDDRFGEALMPPRWSLPRELTGVRILAATPDVGQTGGGTVLLMNTSDLPVSLEGCALVDELERRQPLRKATLRAGQVHAVRLSGRAAQLTPKRGGLLTLVDERGMKVHGVAYTRRTKQAGWSIVF